MVSLRSPSTLPIVGVLVDGKTYRHLLYLLLAVPVGFIYSTLFSFGFLFGVVFSVVLVGLVLLVATLLGARIAAGFERWLANRLLGTDLDRYDDVPADAGGAVANVRKYVDAASTWRGVGFLSLKFFVTVLAFVPLFALANGLPLVVAPLRYPYVVNFGESNGEPVTWAIETLPEALLAVPVGIVGVLAALHITNLVAYVCRRMATALLGEPTADDGASKNSAGTGGPAPTDSALAAGSAPTDPASAHDEPEDDEPEDDEPEDEAPTGAESVAPEADEFIPADAVDPESDDGSDRGEDRS
ncbi:sensor domain-containing protein [Halorubrum amylolyticum]|uniref:sensor domain-containing protein n=1 Tax=Halorubrum amylolyticum TaxID=2508724 RepID=UPI0010092D17|nr:sensor domain-containing protein [Halorubrum amylolyticum]